MTREAAQAWQQENQAAIEAWNAHVEEQGVPLAEYRQFCPEMAVTSDLDGKSCPLILR